jgi:hypothetical protein
VKEKRRICPHFHPPWGGVGAIHPFEANAVSDFHFDLQFLFSLKYLLITAVSLFLPVRFFTGGNTFSS